MADDFNNLRNFKNSLSQTTENGKEIKTIVISKNSHKIRFIITKSKQDSWVDDLCAQSELNRMDQVYH